MPPKTFQPMVIRMLTFEQYVRWCRVDCGVGPADAEITWGKMMESNLYEKDNCSPEGALRIGVQVAWWVDPLII